MQHISFFADLLVRREKLLKDDFNEIIFSMIEEKINTTHSFIRDIIKKLMLAKAQKIAKPIKPKNENTKKTRVRKNLPRSPQN